MYGRSDLTAVSWYQDRPQTSLRLLGQVCAPADPVVDVGAGASTLVDELRAEGWSDVTVLDVSATALEVVRGRLDGDPAVSLVVADLLAWRPERAYAGWHDRAVFHFLVDPDDRRRYRETAAAAVRPGGALVVGAFAADGPQSCSGLPTARYDAASLSAELAPEFAPVHAEREGHRTPGGAEQAFTWVVLRRS